MKRKSILLFLLLIVFFAAFVNHDTKAQDVTLNSSQVYTGLATSPLLPGATNQAIMGIRFDKAAGAGNTLNSLVIQCDQDPSLIFSSVTLRNSIDDDFGGSEPTTATGTINGSPANTITFSPSFSLGGNGATTTYFFIVVTVRADVSITTPITLSFDGNDMTLSDNNPIASGSLTSGTYSALGATIGSLNDPDDNGVADTPLVPGATNQAIFGFSLSSNGSQTVSAINVQMTSDPAGKFSGYSLVQSTDDDYATNGDNSVILTSSITASATQVQITPTTAINISTAKNLFLVANVDAGTSATTPDIQASLGATNITVNQGIRVGSATGIEYEFLGATIGSLNGGGNNVAASPLPGGSTGKAIFGFSLSSNGSQTVSSIDIQLSTTPTGKLSGFSLIQSTDTDFATTIDNTPVATSSINIAGTEVQITPSSPIDISALKNLFLIANVDPTVTVATTSITASLTATDITVNQGGRSGSATGTAYTFVAPTATIASLNAGANNVSASPIPAGANGRAIFGFSLTSDGSQTVSAIDVQFSTDPTAIFSSYSLIQSTDNDFATTVDNSSIATTSITLVGNELQILPSSAIDISSAKNLFLVANIDPTVTVASGPITASLTNTDITVNIGDRAGSATGTAYAFTAATATIASLDDPVNNGVADSPIIGGASGQAIFGFSLTSDGSQTVSMITIPFTVAPAGRFSGYSLVVSVDDDFGTTGDNSPVSGSILVAGTDLQFTPSVAIDISTTKNLFLVANVDPLVTGASGPIQASLGTANFSVNQGDKGGSASGIAYNFTPLIATIASLNNPGNNGVADSPITGGATSQAIFGFSLTSTGSQTVSVINIPFTIAPTGRFSGYSLVLSTDDDFGTTGDNSVVGTTSIVVAGNEVQITPSAAIDISATKNLFLVANVDHLVTGTSGPIQASLGTANFSVNQGDKGGSASGNAYNFTQLTATIASLNDPINNGVASSPLFAGSTNQAVFGFSLTSNGSQTVSAINIPLTSTPTGKLAGFSLVLSVDDDFGSAGDNSVVGTTSLSVVGTTVQITPSSAIDISSVKNLFLVANVDAAVTGSTPVIQASLTDTDFVVNQGYKGNSAIGINYSFSSSQTTAITVSYGGQTTISLGEYSDDEVNPVNVTEANSEQIFGISITDGDIDSHGTTITELVFNLTNTDNLATISLFDGTTKIASQVVAGSTVTFTGLSYVIADGSIGSPNTETLDIRVTFASNVGDNETIAVTLTSATASATGSGIAAFAGIETIAGRNEFDVDATVIQFLNPPSVVSPVLNFGLTIQATDSRGNVDTDMGGNITLTKDGSSTGAGNLSATDAGGLTRALSSGVVSWSQIQISLAGDYTIRANHSGALADITLDLEVISLGMLVTGPANQNFCFGGSFVALTPIVMAERDPSDLGTGNNVSFSFMLPAGFVFNTALTSVTPAITGGSNVSDVTAITYLANNIARFTYDVSGVNSLDEITISGLEVRYTDTVTVGNQNIVRIGGSALQQGNNVDTNPLLSHGTLSASAASNAGYTFIVDEFTGQPAVDQNETRFSISVAGVKLLPGGSNPVTAGTVFSGNGVSYSSTQGSYIFSPASVGVGTYEITMTVSNGSCNVTVVKTFEVFATTITNLANDYCSNASPSTGLSLPASTLDFVINNYLVPYYGGTYSEWQFHDFVYYDVNTGFQPIPAPNTTFDPQAPQYQSSILNFGGVYIYYRARNTNPASPYNTNPIIWDGQFVIIQQAPNVTLNLPTTAFCYNGTSVDLDAAANPSPNNPSTDLFSHSHSGPAGINQLGNQWTFTPGGVQDANVNPQTFNITYEYTNPSTNCSNSVMRTVTVYPTPTPVPASDITSGTTLLVCKDGLSGDFSGTSVPGTIYSWYDDTASPPALRTGNLFNPNGYFDATTPGSTNFRVTRTINGCESSGPHLQLTVTVNPLPTVDAGPTNTSICAGDEILIGTLGATFGGAASSATWNVSSAIPGTFLDASDAVVSTPAPFGTAVKYIPSVSEVNLGNVTLTLTTNDPSGPCGPVSDFVQVIINSVAQANAGTNQSVCSGSPVQLNGTIGGAATTQTWYKNIVDPGNIVGTSLSETYSPTVTELQNGAVINFILVTDDPPGLCPAASSTVNVVINQKPSVDAGSNQVVCSGEQILLDGSFGATASSVTWSGGTGSFTASTSEDTEYLPTTTELQNGAVITFTLITDDPTGPCLAESDVVQVTINPIPNAPLATSPAPYCVNDPVTNLTAIGTNLKWYDDAPLTNQVSAGSTFASGVLADAEKIVSFYVTQTLLGCESPSTTVTITVNPLPIPDYTASNYCFGDAMQFTDASTVDNGIIVKWGWRFADGDELQRGSGPILSGTHNDRTTGSYDAPMHTYASIGTYNIALTVESDKGCVQTKNDTVYSVGSVPHANFISRDVCENDTTRFFSANTNPQPAVITTWEWDFGDPTSGGDNTSLLQHPTHQFTGTGSASGTYDVTLRMVTALGCESIITKKVSILPYIQSFPFTESFESPDHGWVTDGLNNNQFNSWQLTTPSGQIINAAADGTMAWYTHVDSINTYFNNERSVLYGPCLDMTMIDRPVLSIQYWNNTDQGNDGAYMETSVDGGLTWQLLGGLNQGGLNWYNRAAILGLAQQNGVGQPIGQVGWSGDTWETGETTGWTSAKFNLDPLRNETKLRVRFVFGSNGDNPTDRTVDGFAIDDFRIEQRNRTILAENFTNDGAPQAQTNNAQFRDFQGTVTSNELIKIQYHTSIGGADPIHTANQADPNARAAFYGVTSSLKGYIDGTSQGDFLAPAWANNEYNSRTLVASPLDIAINASTAPSAVFTVESTITINTDLPLNRQYVVHTAIVEEQVGDEQYVLRKLLPSAAGVPLTALEANQIQTVTVSALLTNISDPSRVSVIVFVQELHGAREVLQAALLDNVPPPTIVTSVEDNATEQVLVFPNPADDVLNIILPEAARSSIPFVLYDAFGHTVHESTFRKGERSKTVNTREFSAGVYLLQFKSDYEFAGRKVMVLHK